MAYLHCHRVACLLQLDGRIRASYMRSSRRMTSEMCSWPCTSVTCAIRLGAHACKAKCVYSPLAPSPSSMHVLLNPPLRCSGYANSSQSGNSRRGISSSPCRGLGPACRLPSMRPRHSMGPPGCCKPSSPQARTWCQPGRSTGAVPGGQSCR